MFLDGEVLVTRRLLCEELVPYSRLSNFSYDAGFPGTYNNYAIIFTREW